MRPTGIDIERLRVIPFVLDRVPGIFLQLPDHLPTVVAGDITPCGLILQGNGASIFIKANVDAHVLHIGQRIHTYVLLCLVEDRGIQSISLAHYICITHVIVIGLSIPVDIPALVLACTTTRAQRLPGSHRASLERRYGQRGQRSIEGRYHGTALRLWGLDVLAYIPSIVVPWTDHSEIQEGLVTAHPLHPCKEWVVIASVGQAPFPRLDVWHVHRVVPFAKVVYQFMCQGI